MINPYGSGQDPPGSALSVFRVTMVRPHEFAILICFDCLGWVMTLQYDKEKIISGSSQGRMKVNESFLTGIVLTYCIRYGTLEPVRRWARFQITLVQVLTSTLDCYNGPREGA